MIQSLTIEGFKSLEKITLNLSNLNLFIGTNASGKSNFFDALRVLQGIAYGFTIDEIFNGKPKNATSEVWDSIRGGSSKAAFTPRGHSTSERQTIQFSVTIKLPNDPGNEIQYSISISAERGWVIREKLQVTGSLIFEAHPSSSLYHPKKVSYYKLNQETPENLQLETDRSVLHQLLRKQTCLKVHANRIEQCIRTLSNMQHLDPSPAILRGYSQAHTAQRMGERGENFAALVKTIITDVTEKSAFVSWLKELTPTELDDVSILSGVLGESLFALKEGKIYYPAPILSDGTLRFAAITAAFFQPDLPEILTLEEIENGLHPTRLRLLVELMKAMSKSGNVQVMATTHSPLILEWLNPEDYATTFVCKRDESTGATNIIPLIEIPDLLKLIQKQPISELFAEGWFEGVL